MRSSVDSTFNVDVMTRNALIHDPSCLGLFISLEENGLDVHYWNPSSSLLPVFFNHVKPHEADSFREHSGAAVPNNEQ